MTYRTILRTSAALTLALVGVQASAAELVTNGGFETGDFTGYTLSGNPGFISVANNSSAYEGTHYGSFGAVGSDTVLSQDLATVAGQSYTISFALRNNAGPTNDFSANFGGTNLLSLNDASPFGFTLYTYTATATAATTTLSFGFRQDPSFFNIDAISVQGVPEPATWALMIAGFGMVGSAMRRRRSDAAFA